MFQIFFSLEQKQAKWIERQIIYSPLKDASKRKRNFLNWNNGKGVMLQMKQNSVQTSVKHKTATTSIIILPSLTKRFFKIGKTNILRNHWAFYFLKLFIRQVESIKIWHLDPRYRYIHECFIDKTVSKKGQRTFLLAAYFLTYSLLSQIWHCTTDANRKTKKKEKAGNDKTDQLLWLPQKLVYSQWDKLAVEKDFGTVIVKN